MNWFLKEESRSPFLSDYTNYPSDRGNVEDENAAQYATLFREEELMTTDPVCGMKIDENNAPAETQLAGKNYSFCSEQCKDKFERSPEQYVENAA